MSSPRVETTRISFAGLLLAVMLVAGGLNTVTAAGDSWTSGPTMGTARMAPSVVALDGQIYVIGGHKDTGELNVMERLDPGSGEWTSDSMDWALTGMMSAAHGGRVWTFGGFFNIEGQDAPWDGVFAYDPSSDSWSTEFTSMPTKRGLGTAQVAGGKAYVMGGFTCSGGSNSYSCDPTDRMEIYDFESDSWSSGPPMPSALAFTASAMVDGKIWVIGGVDDAFSSTPDWDGNTGKMTDKVFVFDPPSGTWDEGTPLPQGRSHHAAFYAEGWIYAAGGNLYQYNGYPITNSVIAYSPAEDRWATATPMPTARNGLGVAMTGGLAHAIGGLTDSYSHSTRNEVYTPFVPDPDPGGHAGNETQGQSGNETRKGADGDFIVERRDPEPLDLSSLPDTKIGNAIRGNPNLVADARAYRDEAAELAEKVEPAVEGLERVLAVRDYLEDKEAFGVTAWEALTTAEPTTGAIMDAVDTGHRELSGVHSTARGLERAGTELDLAITSYASDPSPQNEELVRSAFEGAIPAYRQASLDLSRAAGHLSTATGHIEDLQSYLIEREDQAVVGPYFKEAADRIGDAAAAVRGMESDLRVKAADLDRDASIMEEALAEEEASPLGWPAPLLAAAMLALLAFAARSRASKEARRVRHG